jgi:hypothetical protein
MDIHWRCPWPDDSAISRANPARPVSMPCTVISARRIRLHFEDRFNFDIGHGHRLRWSNSTKIQGGLQHG